MQVSSVLQNSRRLISAWRRRRSLTGYFSPAYHLPISGLELSGFEPRRAEFALWYLLDRGALSERDVRTPTPVPLSTVALAHRVDYLEALLEPSTLSRIFAVERSDIPVAELWQSIRLACGGTVSAAGEALRSHSAVFNFLGGFHHAAPDSGGGFCAINDVAVAVFQLRKLGFREQVVIIDLDAHPPDGTEACLVDDDAVWIGSLSGCDWGPLPGVHEVVLPSHCDDTRYLDALRDLLMAAPKASLAFVLAGGDVIAGDRLGNLGLSLQGAYERDALVAKHLAGTPSVWLPAGGYSKDAWKVIAGTALAVRGLKRDAKLDSDTWSPLEARYRSISSEIPSSLLGGGELTERDIEADLHIVRQPEKFLGFYTAHGIEYALLEYGILDLLEGLGYRDIAVAVRTRGRGENVSVTGVANEERHLLIDCVASRQSVAGAPQLFIEWLTLRHPVATFGPTRPQLPGQEVPGLGILPEVAELLLRMAERLQLPGVVFRPASYHVAVIAASRFHFVDSARQGRFEALRRDSSHLALGEVSRALGENRVTLNGSPYRWEADEMVFSETVLQNDPKSVLVERDSVKFAITLT
jgi:acetoin utilization deacetylase AcuC-like enzyme